MINFIYKCRWILLIDSIISTWYAYYSTMSYIKGYCVAMIAMWIFRLLLRAIVSPLPEDDQQ